MRENPLANRLLQLGANQSVQLPGATNDAVRQLRVSAVNRLAEVGLPKITDENWRYTNIRAMESIPFELSVLDGLNVKLSDMADIEIPGLDTYRITLVDGWIEDKLSDLEQLPKEVEIRTLKDILNHGDELVVERLRCEAANATHGFEALNIAAVTDGLVVRVANGAKLNRPLEILNISSVQANTRLCSINHSLVIEKGAELTLLERYVSLGSTNHLTSASISLDIGEAAVVEHIRIQNESESAFHVGSTHVSQSERSRYMAFTCSLGALLDRHELAVSLDGEQSHSGLNGLFVGRGKQHVDNYTTVTHAVPRCASSEFYKGILNERARAVFHGRITVNPGAQQTDAQQQNKNLLLSNSAEADTKPQLEIYADDVKCSHGATVGYLDAEAIFYLRSRGLSDADARMVLTEAFAMEIIDQLENGKVKDYISYMIRSKLIGEITQRKAA